MIRILSDFAYGDGPTRTCFWGPSTVSAPKPQGDQHVQVAVIGAGYTGLSAALHLAQQGADITVLEAQSPGWGASGRNGGFCCLGGTALTGGQIRKRVGKDGLRHWRQTEVAAINTVRTLLSRHKIQADTHSDGETILAHSARAMRALRAERGELETEYGVSTTLHEAEELPQLGMRGAYHGALTLQHGFGLNPRKYADGLARAAMTAGARIFANSPVRHVTRQNGSFTLTTPTARIRADKVIFATNGYSSEDVPPWMRARFLPLQSNVLVTRVLTPEEIATGWSSAQMAYTHQTLLHYFPTDAEWSVPVRDARGAVYGPSILCRPATPNAPTVPARLPFLAPRGNTLQAGTELWLLPATCPPYAGPIPEMPDAFTAFAYHGNGVAMATHTGAILARLALGQDAGDHYPQLMQNLPKRFPLGRYRRLLMAPAYVAAALSGR